MRRVPMAEVSETFGALRARILEKEFDAMDCVLVVDDGRLVGVVSIDVALSAAASEIVGSRMRAGWPRARPEDDQELVSARALHAHVSAVPVVTRQGEALGLVPSTALLRIARNEHVDDLHLLAGVQRETAHARIELSAPPVRRARHRLPWLIVGLAGSIGAACVVAEFERALHERLALAFFVPMIVYLADAIGTQTEAIVVRGLSLSQLSLGELLAKEFPTGALIGGALGALAFPAVSLLFGATDVALVVALAIVIAGAVATTIGLVLPYLLHRAGSDPALGGGPLATIIQDVLSIAIYFGLASAIIP